MTSLIDVQRNCDTFFLTHVVNVAPPEDVNVNLTDSPAVGWTKNIFKVFLSFTVRPPKKAQDTLFKLLIENSQLKAIVRIRSALLPTLCSDQIFNREEEHSYWLQRSMLTVLQFIVFLLLLLIRFLLFPA